ncbi:MAG: aminotransferase class IV [Bryobacteraceae bacterium]|nr:aminotransferase class IV [Bryobacteraceae bacterium]
MHRYLLYNDGVRETTEKFLSPGQVGLLNGWGVFSTLRVKAGVLFAWERHYARMRRDAEVLHVPFADSDYLTSRLAKLIAANKAWDSTLRIAVVRNQGGVFDAPNLDRDFDLIAFTKPLANWGTSMRLGLVPQARHAANVFRGTKMLSWCFNLTWNESARQQDFDEVVLLNERGEVAELTSANLFIVRGNEILTPPLDSGCLPGITRALILEEITVPGYRIGEAVLTPADLAAADEVFVTSSTRDTLPVAAIENLKLRFVSAEECIGRIAVQQRFDEYLDTYVSQRKPL